MNPILLYLLLAKATLTSFSGLTSLPAVREDLVKRHHVLTDRQLNAAVAAGRTVPGPNGLYIVSVGYFVAGTPGAIAGCLAMVTPAFLIVPVLRYLGARAETRKVKSAIATLLIGAAGLVTFSTVPLARDSITGVVPAAIALGAFAYTAFTKKPTLWLIAASAAVAFAARIWGLAH
jgi:chromate transporter